MSLGLVRFPRLDLEGEITEVRLQHGSIVIASRIDGPAALPAGLHELVIYGRDGMQVSVLNCKVEGGLVVGVWVSLDIHSVLEVGSTIPWTEPSVT